MNTTILNFSELKNINQLAVSLDIDFRELVNNITNNCEDFEIDNYRFIHSDYIDNIQVEELESDPYILGFFNADFLSDIIGLDSELIQIIQDSDKYDKLGKYLINNNFVEDIQKEYSSTDGYGHHFAHYDHETNEININNNLYYYFRVN